MVRKFIITGGPCTGKTSVINELAKDFKVVQEASRTVFDSGEWDITNENFQNAVFEQQLEHEELASRYHGVVFFDRGLCDTLAYYRYYDFEVPEKVIEACEEADYEIVFFLDFVPYTKDKMRTEGKEEAEKIHDFIYSAYEECGYRIVKVPLMSIKERADFIKKFVE